MSPAHAVEPALSVARTIAAPAARVYAILADYRQGHPSILPRPPFGELRVEAGGYGDGTRISYDMRVLGRTQIARAAVSEPEPGRVLMETDVERGFVTTFTVDALDATRCTATIATTLPPRRGGFGVLGALERALFARVLRPVYVEELQHLERAARA